MYQATHKVGCQPGDYIWSFQSSSGDCVGWVNNLFRGFFSPGNCVVMYGPTYEARAIHRSGGLERKASWWWAMNKSSIEWWSHGRHYEAVYVWKVSEAGGWMGGHCDWKGITQREEDRCTMISIRETGVACVGWGNISNGLWYTAGMGWSTLKLD